MIRASDFTNLKACDFTNPKACYFTRPKASDFTTPHLQWRRVEQAQNSDTRYPLPSRAGDFTNPRSSDFTNPKASDFTNPKPSAAPGRGGSRGGE